MTWAVDQKVDIISMSWTIERKTEKTNSPANKTSDPAISDLEVAIQSAVKDDIIMFCAARDQGQDGDLVKLYPSHGCREMLRIGAAVPSGDRWTWVNDKAVDFLFPGVELSPEPHRKSMSDKGLTPEGSSVATAFAAGLAALVIFCVRLSSKEGLPNMKDPEKIRSLFKFLSGTGLAKYVNVRDLLQLQTISSRHSKKADLETIVENVINWSRYKE